MIYHAFTSAVAVILLAMTLTANMAAGKFGASDVSLKNELSHAMNKGADWLVKNQASEGYWSTEDQPAVTGLAILALQSQELEGDGREAVEKGYQFILSCVQPDGSIHNNKGLVNYNTSICLLAFSSDRSDRFRPQILKARQFLIGSQIDMGEKGKLDTPFDGGIGYGSRYEHSDMGNTLQALEALYYSRHFVSDSVESKQQDLNWEAAIHFLENCQNLPSHNDQEWASGDPANKGGFIYYPGESKAGEMELPGGRVALRSYGSISYAGLLSYIYADLEKTDPRVTAVLDWLKKNYTLEENPGMGQQGLYYYFHTMAKALSAAEVERLSTPEGVVQWRKRLALRMLNLQNADGSWANENNRWWEKDPALVTSYGMMTLAILKSGS